VSVESAKEVTAAPFREGDAGIGRAVKQVDQAAGVVHGDDESVRARQLFDQRICQMRRERCDTSMARQVIPERGESSDLIRTLHTVSCAAWRAARAFATSAVTAR